MRVCAGALGVMVRTRPKKGDRYIEHSGVTTRDLDMRHLEMT